MRNALATIIRCLVICASLFLAHPNALAQSKDVIDSLKSRLSSDVDNIGKVDIYISLAKEYTREDSALAFEYSQKAYTLAREMRYLQGMFQSFYTRSAVYLSTGSLDQADSMVNIMWQFADSTSYLEGKRDSYRQFGLLNYYRGEYDDAIVNYDKAISIAESIDDKPTIGSLLGNIAIIHFIQGDYYKALDRFLSSTAIKTELNDEKGLANNYNNIGALYDELEENDKALDFFLRALAIDEKTSNSYGLANDYVNIGTIYHFELKEYDSANYYYQKSVEKFESIGDRHGLAIVYGNLGAMYGEEGKYAQAIQDLSTADSLNLLIDAEQNRGPLFVDFGDVYYKLGQIQRAKREYARGLKNGQRFEIKQVIQNAAKGLAQVESDLGNYKEALEAQILFKQMSDSLSNEDNTRAITRLEAEFEFQQERDSIAFEQQRASLAYEKEISRQEWIKSLVAAFAIFLAIIAFILYRSYRRKQSDNLLLAEKNEHLKELREKEQKLSKEAITIKDRELATMAMATHEKNSLLKELEQKVSFIERRLDEDELKPSLKEIQKTISSSYSLDKSWDSFLHRFEDVYPQFFDRLKDENISLTVDDLKLCAYLKIGMNNKEIANVTHLALSSVKSKINRLKKKLEMRPEENLRDYMIKYV